jgi:hypothetical protein
MKVEFSAHCSVLIRSQTETSIQQLNSHKIQVTIASLSGELECDLFSPYPEEKDYVCHRMTRYLANYMQRNKTYLDKTKKLQMCLEIKKHHL